MKQPRWHSVKTLVCSSKNGPGVGIRNLSHMSRAAERSKRHSFCGIVSLPKSSSSVIDYGELSGGVQVSIEPILPMYVESIVSTIHLSEPSRCAVSR